MEEILQFFRCNKTMSDLKKKIRQNFRDTCFKRDKYSCVMCGFKSSLEKALQDLDAHHITDRTLMPNGGYVAANGISLCSSCHEKAEEYHSTGAAYIGYSVEDLYKAINSSYELALEASKKLKQ